MMFINKTLWPLSCFVKHSFLVNRELLFVLFCRELFLCSILSERVCQTVPNVKQEIVTNVIIRVLVLFSAMPVLSNVSRGARCGRLIPMGSLCVVREV